MDPGEENRVSAENVDERAAAAGDTVPLLPPAGDVAAAEDPAERKARIRSLYIVHVTVCVFCLGFSIVLTGVYPYMKQLLPYLDQPGMEDELMSKYGWVVAVNPLGQTIFSPIFGYLGNRLGSIRGICLATSVLYVAGNILYSTLSLFLQDKRFALLIVARLLVGVSAANIAPLRSYIAAATFEHERTLHMSLTSAAQGLGFLLGPLLQLALIPIECSPAAFDPSLTRYIALDMFTAAGWISVALGIVTFLLFLPCVFEEFDVATLERKQLSDRRPTKCQGGDTASELGSPDRVVMAVLVVIFIIYVFNFTLFEVLATPMVMDEFGWSESDAIKYLGILLGAVALQAVGSYATVGHLSKRFDERSMMIWLGILPMAIGRILLMPLPGKHPHLAHDINNSTGTSYFNTNHATPFGKVACGGDKGPPFCGHTWCDDQPAIAQWQFFLSFFVGSFGYPYCIALSQSLFSKIIGPRPQGTWMGLLTGSGSLARVLGPIAVSFVYNKTGLYATSGMMLSLMLLTLLLTLVSFKRLVPFSESASSTPLESNVAGSQSDKSISNV